MNKFENQSFFAVLLGNGERFTSACRFCKMKGTHILCLGHFMKLFKKFGFLFLLSAGLSPSAVYAEDTFFTITIDRNMTCQDQSTIGRIIVNEKEIGRTLELPWQNNETGVSRIPPGTYDAFIRSDGNKRWRIQLQDVTDDTGHTRELVQIHVGNYAREIRGCILVGSDITQSPNGDCMVPNSRATLDKLSSEMAKFSQDLGGNQSTNIAIQVVVK